MCQQLAFIVSAFYGSLLLLGLLIVQRKVASGGRKVARGCMVNYSGVVGRESGIC